MNLLLVASKHILPRLQYNWLTFYSPYSFASLPFDSFAILYYLIFFYLLKEYHTFYISTSIFICIFKYFSSKYK